MLFLLREQIQLLFKARIRAIKSDFKHVVRKLNELLNYCKNKVEFDFNIFLLKISGQIGHKK